MGVDRADAALITNISEDHLGDFGSRNLDELLAIKWIVSRVVRAQGRLILNAGDHRLVAKARDYDGELVWFCLDAGNAVVRKHVDAGGLAFALDGDELVKLEKGARDVICRGADIPLALGGAARHNVANALSAAALTWCLGATLEEIASGLTTMEQDKNPGRCNLYDLNGIKILVDFAHNPAAMAALFDMASAIPASRRALCFGQAGDRTDDLIRELARDAWAIGLDRVEVSELADYHRGRDQGEVFGIIRDELIKQGASDRRSCTTSWNWNHCRMRSTGRDLATWSSCWRWAAPRRCSSGSGNWALDKPDDCVGNILCLGWRQYVARKHVVAWIARVPDLNDVFLRRARGADNLERRIRRDHRSSLE